MTRRTRGTASTYAAAASVVALAMSLAAEPFSVGAAPLESRGTTLAAPTAKAGRTLAGRVGASPRVHQLLTVSASTWSTTQATLKAWRRNTDGRWRLAHGPVSVILGYNGWVRANNRRQSTGTTPAGRFTLPYAFGRLSDPGAHVRYRQFDRNDWWPYEPRDKATYNIWQWHKARTTNWRADKSEHLWDFGAQYAYGIVVGFNQPSGVHYSTQRRQWVARHTADTSRGGGIFLHVRGDGPTAGCVAMRRAQMRWLIRWLRPKAEPQIVMGPYSYITR
jgi:L,D-peptidoglycan transpeptidase YkuD (ErfK/YbiS/YcfS/YnhG family)